MSSLLDQTRAGLRQWIADVDDAASRLPVAGGLFGSEIGKSLDKADKMHLERTTQNSLEYNKAGQTSTWRNPDSGNAGSVTPTSTYKSANGKDCREYKTKIVVDGKEETGTGRACRDAEGNWRLVS